MDFSLVEYAANIISIVAGVMTILGIGGVLSWSLVKKSRESFPDAVISVSAISLKLGLCVLSLWLLAIPVFFLHIFIVLSLGKGTISAGEMFWEAPYWYAYSVSYFVGVLVWLPVYSLTCASIFAWSLKPFSIFYSRLKRHES